MMKHKQNSMVKQSNQEMGMIYKDGLNELRRIRLKIKIAWIIMFIMVALIGLKYAIEPFIPLLEKMAQQP